MAFGRNRDIMETMSFWQNIRRLLRRERGLFSSRSAFSRAGLGPGAAIRPEPMVRHVVSVAFARPDVDDATYRLLKDRRYWKASLREDRALAERRQATIAVDELLMAILDQQAIGTVIPPKTCPLLPLDFLPYSTVGYSERVAELAERCDQMLGFAVTAPNTTPLRVAWPLVHHLARLAARDTGGLILDCHSQRWWSLDRWSAVNPYGDADAILNWVAIHDVVGAGSEQLHTHGMKHFGLPDLELADVPRSFRAGAWELIEAACQGLIAGAFSENRGLKVGDEIKVLEEGGAASFRFVPGDPAAAQIDNRLLRLSPAARFGDGPRGLAACLAALFPDQGARTHDVFE